MPRTKLRIIEGAQNDRATQGMANQQYVSKVIRFAGTQACGERLQNTVGQRSRAVTIRRQGGGGWLVAGPAARQVHQPDLMIAGQVGSDVTPGVMAGHD